MDLKIVSGTPAPETYGLKGTEALVDPTFQAVRVVPKPFEYKANGQVLGHYSVAALTGLTTGISANGAIFSMRWSDSSKLFILLRVSVGAILTTAFGTAQAVDADVIAQRGFTAADTSGTAITLTGNNQKTAQRMSPSLVADMRISTTAALTAGTKTADSQAFGVACFPNTNAIATGSAPVDLYKLDAAGQHPMMFGKDEGFNVRIPTAQGATGVVKYYIRVDWAEVASL